MKIKCIIHKASIQYTSASSCTHQLHLWLHCLLVPEQIAQCVFPNWRGHQYLSYSLRREWSLILRTLPEVYFQRLLGCLRRQAFRIYSNSIGWRFSSPWKDRNALSQLALTEWNYVIKTRICIISFLECS